MMYDILFFVTLITSVIIIIFYYIDRGAEFDYAEVGSLLVVCRVE